MEKSKSVLLIEDVEATDTSEDAAPTEDKDPASEDKETRTHKREKKDRERSRERSRERRGRGDKSREGRKTPHGQRRGT